MVSKKKDEYLKKCRNRIAAAKKYRENEGYDKLWERLIDSYSGKQFPKYADLQEDRISVNVSFANINTIWSSVSGSYPKIAVNARTEDDIEGAIIAEAMVNYWWKHRDFKTPIQLAKKESLIIGHGWLKVGWRYVEDEIERPQEDIQAELAQRSMELNQYAVENPDLASEMPTDEELLGLISTTESIPVEDAPFVERVSPFDILVDPEATCMSDAKWIAQRIYRPIEEVRRDKKYKKRVRLEVKDDYLVEESMRTPDGDRDKDNKRAAIYEYYDLKNGTFCVFADSSDDFLVDPIDQPYSFGHPFVMIRNYDIPGKFYPMGELEAIEDLQAELNKTRSQMLNHRKRGARKWLYDPRAFDDAALGDLTNEIDGTAIRVNEGVPLNEAVIPVPTVAIDPQLYQWTMQIEDDINSISGVNEYMRGGADQSIRRSATEASIIAEASNARAADKLNRFELVNAEIARRVVMLAQQYMTTDEAIRITGKDQKQIWGVVEPEFIQGEFDFEVEAGSTKPRNEAYRMQQASQLFQALIPLAQSGFINVPELVKFFIEQGFDVKDGAKFVQMPPQIDPMTGQPMGALPPGGAPPEQGGDPNGALPTEADILAQLAGQIGYGGAVPSDG